MSEKEGRLRALDLTPSAAKFNGGSEEVLLVLTPDNRVKALTPRQAKIAWEDGKLIGWTPIGEEPKP